MVKCGKPNTNTNWKGYILGAVGISVISFWLLRDTNNVSGIGNNLLLKIKGPFRCISKYLVKKPVRLALNFNFIIEYVTLVLISFYEYQLAFVREISRSNLAKYEEMVIRNHSGRQ